MIDRQRKLERRATITSVVVALQILATIFFLIDFSRDLRTDGLSAHLLVEGLATFGLLAGVVFGTLQIRWLVLQSLRDSAAVATARGAMSELVQLRFSEWHLTKAESDVALFALKGCDIAHIAQMRVSAPGTVRAQLARVYAKAGVQSQVQLMALFVDELVDTMTDLTPPPTP